MDIKGMEHISEARAVVDRICEENGWDLRKTSDWNKVLGEIDRKYDQRRYKCRYCFDSGIITWIDMDDGLFHGRKCGFCRYWDEQREKARREKEARGIKE